MKIAIVTDTHWGARNDSQLFLDHFSDFFEESFFPTLKKYDIDTVIHAGDLLDRRKFVNFNTLSHVRNKFMKPLKDMGVTVHCILGNHDTFYKNTNDLNSLEELFVGKYDNFILYEKPTVVNFDGFEISFLPWVNRENQQESLKFIEDTKTDWLIGHLELTGYEPIRGVKWHDGMNPDLFKKFEQVLSGHFHCKQDKGNILYLGTPYQITFSDVGEQKGFWILDTDTREMEYIQNKKRMFYTIVYNDLDNKYDKFISKNHKKYKDSYVKIYVTNKDHPYILDKVIDTLYNSGVFSLNVIEDMGSTFDFEENETADMTKTTLELLFEEIDNNENVNNPKAVKEMIKELYMESLTV